VGERKDVPQLGDLSSSFDEVNHFYDFWLSFKSWREVPHPDEEKIEEGMVSKRSGLHGREQWQKE